MFTIAKIRSSTNNDFGFEDYAVYEIGPFFRGQGVLVVNALRRVMVNHLPDIAVVAVFIPEVRHEFDFVPSVKEDFIDLSLNLKQVRFRGMIEGPVFGRLRANSARLVCAGDLELSVSTIEIVNPDQHIATLTGGQNFELDFLVTRGQGSLWSDELCFIIPDGWLAIDAVFCPVAQASVSGDSGRVISYDQPFQVDLERIHFEVWTYGGLTPGEAITWAARILQNSFACLAGCENLDFLEVKSSFSSIELIKEDKSLLELYSKTKFGMLEFSSFTRKRLVLSNIYTLADLSKLSVFALERIFKVEKEESESGKRAVKEVVEKLEEFCGIILPQRLSVEKPGDPGEMSVNTMGFSQRVISGFERANIRSLADIMTYSVEELAGIPKMGIVSVKEVQAKLKAEFGIGLEKKKLVPTAAASPINMKTSTRPDQIEETGVFLGEDLDIAPPNDKEELDIAPPSDKEELDIAPPSDKGDSTFQGSFLDPDEELMS
jgi:DNA-directed RNA polymerase subunit alpha